MHSLLRSALLVASLAPSSSAQPILWERTPGPYGGRIWDLAAVPGAVLALDVDGLKRTMDGGVWWEPSETGFSGLRLSALDTGPDGSVYAQAATGAIIHSTDGGLTWARFDDGIPEGFAQGTLAFSPAGERYLATAVGLYRRASDDALWAITSLNGEVLAVAVGPDGVVLASTREADDPDEYFAVKRSEDGGQTWTTIPLRWGIYATVRAITFLPDGTALAGGAEEPKGYVDPGLFRSTNAGLTWSAVPGREAVSLEAFEVDDGAAPNGAVYYRSRIHRESYRSTDGGRTWSPNPFAVYGLGRAADGGLLAASDHIGAQRSDDDGQTWADATAGLGYAIVGRIALGPDGTTYTTSAEDFGFATPGLFRSDDGGLSWVRFAADGRDGVLGCGVISMLVDHADRLFVAPGRSGSCHGPSLYRSLDRGATWEDVSPDGAGLVADMELDVAGALYVCSGPAMYLSTDGGATWDRRGSRGCEEEGGLAITPGNVLFVGGYSSEGGLYYSTDDAATWGRVPEITGHVQEVAAGPDGSVYAATWLPDMRRIYASPDGGATWTSSDIVLERPWSEIRGPILALIGSAFTGTNDPALIFRTINGGLSWEQADTGLPDTYVYTMDFALEGSGHLLAALGDHGLFRSAAQVAATEEAPQIARPVFLPPRPNPAGDHVTLTLRLPNTGAVSLTAYDLLGRRVATLHEGVLRGGEVRVEVEAVGLPAGVYVVRAVGETFTAAQPLTVIR